MTTRVAEKPEMMELFFTIFSAAFVVTVIRTTTPLLLATLGGLIADLSGALNVALEGQMLIGCLTAVIVSVYMPWYVAVIAGVGVGGLLGLLMAFFALRLKADIIPRGVCDQHSRRRWNGVRFSARDGRRQGHLDQPRQQVDPDIRSELPRRHPRCGASAQMSLFSGHSVLSWVAAFLVFAVWYFLYRGRGGLLGCAAWEVSGRAGSGGHSAQQGAHLEPDRVGRAGVELGGAQLAMFNYVGFTRDMTAGVGFIALGAVLLGARHPIGALLAALLFGSRLWRW